MDATEGGTGHHLGLPEPCVILISEPARKLRSSINEHELMTRQRVLDLYFMDARAKLIDLAAFLDRLDRAPGDADFRLTAFRQALQSLEARDAARARQVLLAFSDPTTEPVAAAPGKGACGAWPGTKG